MFDLTSFTLIVQEPKLSVAKSRNYCPLILFILVLFSEHNTKSLKGINLKLHWYIDLDEEKCGSLSHNVASMSNITPCNK